MYMNPSRLFTMRTRLDLFFYPKIPYFRIHKMKVSNMKRYMSNDEIIQSLQIKEDRPLSFSEEELELARNFFNTNNYFSFAIYRKLLPRKKYKDYSFSDCLDIYKFNDFLRAELNKFTGNIELMLRATLIQHLGSYYKEKQKEDKFMKSNELIQEAFKETYISINKVIDKTIINDNKNYDRFINNLMRNFKKLKKNLISLIESPLKSLVREYLILQPDKNLAFEDIYKFQISILEKFEIEIKNYITFLNNLKEDKLNKLYNDSDFKKDKIVESLKLITLDQEFEIEIKNKVNTVIESLVMDKKNIINQKDFSYEIGLLYLDKSIYVSDKKEDLNKLMQKFEDTIKENKSDAIEHYKQKKTGVPIWVLFEELTFGDIYHFLILLKPEFKKVWIEKSFTKELETFIPGWFRSINFLRNNCAHYNRLYGKYFNISPPSLLEEDRKLANIKKEDNKTLFANLLVIKNLLNFHSTKQKEWNFFLTKLKKKIDEKSEVIRIFKMGFPDNWEECLKIERMQDKD